MKLNKINILIFALLASVHVYSQNPNLNYKNAIKVGNLSGYQSNYTRFGNGTSSSSNTIKILHPIITFQHVTKQSNFIEIELNSLNVNNTRSGFWVNNNSSLSPYQTLKNTDISIRAEYNFVYGKIKDRRLVSSVGVGIMPFFNKTKYISFNPNEFSNSVAAGGLDIYIAPKLSYFFKSKFFIDTSFPLHFMKLGVYSNYSNDPSLKESSRKTSVYDFNALFSFYGLRLAIGMKI